MHRKRLHEHPELPLGNRPSPRPVAPGSLAEQLADFDEFGTRTRILSTQVSGPGGRSVTLPTFVNEFWTAKQRAAHSLHEVSYRACFKPQLPRFFIERLTRPGAVVYDPFMGRGTTLLEAALFGRIPFGNDINPLSLAFIRPRLRPPNLSEIDHRLAAIDFTRGTSEPKELLVFYHPETLKEINALRQYLQRRENDEGWDPIDDWIRLVALNRLTGHSPGFFSVYTMPPNQAVSIKSQIRINARRNQTPPRRQVCRIILKKSRQLLGACNQELLERLAQAAARSVISIALADHTPLIPTASVDLVVTSPPFLNVVDYATDNWLRCWFLGLEAKDVPLTIPRKLEDWQEAMNRVFRELHRVLKPRGHIAFEVGEVNRGRVPLEEIALPAGIEAGLEPILVLINDQKFTKTANCWGVENNRLGTNTNRVVLFRKP